MNEIFLNLKECLTTKFACFSGRADRREYWYFVLGEIIVSIAIPVAGGILAAILGCISDSLSAGITTIMVIALGIFCLYVIVPGLSVTVRRLHDIGKSGRAIFVDLIPFVGPIILLVWLCTKSMPEENEYGPEPE